MKREHVFLRGHDGRDDSSASFAAVKTGLDIDYNSSAPSAPLNPVKVACHYYESENIRPFHTASAPGPAAWYERSRNGRARVSYASTTPESTECGILHLDVRKGQCTDASASL